MHQEVHDILATQSARIITTVRTQPKDVRELDPDLRVESQKADAVRDEPLLIPALDQFPQPWLRDRGVVNRLTAGVRAQHPEPPDVLRELSLRIGEQSLDRSTQPPVKHGHHLPSQRAALQQRPRVDARKRVDQRLQPARPLPDIAAIKPGVLEGVEDLQSQPLAQLGEINLDPTARGARAAQRDRRELLQRGLSQPDPMRTAGRAQPRSV